MRKLAVGIENECESLPMLKATEQKSLSLPRIQVSILLANAFFGTFRDSPSRNFCLHVELSKAFCLVMLTKASESSLCHPNWSFALFRKNLYFSSCR